MLTMITRRACIFCLLVVLCVFSPLGLSQDVAQESVDPALKPPVMDQAQMERIIKSMAQSSKGEGGFVEVDFQGMKLYVVSDVTHDRMRIITPIAQYEDITAIQKDIMLESNFHSALDARYAVSKGVLYSVFIHPLSYLSEHEIQSAVIQVFNLSASFGSEYTSNSLNFGAKKQSKTAI